jgi:hypothetical protein
VTWQDDSPDSQPPVKCSHCGQLNAAVNMICVVCKKPLGFEAAPSTPQYQPALADRTAAFKREHREIIAMYIRWCGYSMWLFGLVPLMLGGIALAPSIAKLDLAGICFSGPLTGAGLYILWQAPRVREGLIKGETWPYDIIVKAHLIIYFMLGLMVFGVLALWFDSSSGKHSPSWGALLCVVSPLLTGIVINWYALQAFERTTGRRGGKIRRVALLTGTSDQPSGVKVYTVVAILFVVLIDALTIAGVGQGLEKHPGDLPTIAGGLLTAALPTVILLALAYGVWTCRAWARTLALGVHALIGLGIIMLAIGILPGTSAGSASLFGQFFINLAIFFWFANHPDYFQR